MKRFPIAGTERTHLFMGVRIITPFIFWAPKFSLFFVDLLLRLSLVDKNWLCPIPASLSGDGVAAKGLSFKNEIAHLAPLLARWPRRPTLSSRRH